MVFSSLRRDSSDKRKISPAGEGVRCPLSLQTEPSRQSVLRQGKQKSEINEKRALEGAILRTRFVFVLWAIQTDPGVRHGGTAVVDKAAWKVVWNISGVRRLPTIASVCDQSRHISGPQGCGNARIKNMLAF